MYKYYLYRLALSLAPALPRPLCYRLARGIGRLLSGLPTARRRAVLANLATVYGTGTADREVRRDCRRSFEHAMLNYADLFRLGTPDSVALVRDLRPAGLEHLAEAVRGGKGAILVGAHLGNYDTLVQVLARDGYKVLIPVEPIEPPALLALVRGQRAALGTDFEPIGPLLLRRMSDHLRAGNVVVVLCDRDVQGTGQPVRFFGHTVAMPAAAVLLALRTGAPVLGASGARLPDNRIVGWITPPPRIWEQRAPQTPRERIQSGMDAIAALLEAQIGRDPGQWVVQQPVFAPPVPRLAGAPSLGSARSTPAAAARSALGAPR